MATKVPTAKLRGPFQKLIDKLKVVEFDEVPFSKGSKTGLQPNAHYKHGKNVPGKPKYEYVTDDKGRIVGAYTDDLKLKPAGQKRGPHDRRTPGKRPGDDAGHIFADQFDGAGDKGNLVSQLGTLNKGAWKDMEEEWADAIRAGKKVEVRIDINYAGDDLRPSDFLVEYVVDGEEFVREFVN